MGTAVRFAERMSRLGTEGAFVTLARARKLEAEGKRIVHLEIGEPDFATPDNIVEAAIGAMQNGYTHYTPASGIFEAREAVAGFVSKMLQTQVGPDDVVLVPGSNKGTRTPPPPRPARRGASSEPVPPSAPGRQDAGGHPSVSHLEPGS